MKMVFFIENGPFLYSNIWTSFQNRRKSRRKNMNFNKNQYNKTLGIFRFYDNWAVFEFVEKFSEDFFVIYRN